MGFSHRQTQTQTDTGRHRHIQRQTEYTLTCGQQIGRPRGRPRKLNPGFVVISPASIPPAHPHPASLGEPGGRTAQTKPGPSCGGCLCVCVCVCACVSLSLDLPLSLCLSLSLSLSLRVCECLSVCMFVCECVCVCACGWDGWMDGSNAVKQECLHFPMRRCHPCARGGCGIIEAFESDRMIPEGYPMCKATIVQTTYIYIYIYMLFARSSPCTSDTLRGSSDQIRKLQ